MKSSTQNFSSNSSVWQSTEVTSRSLVNIEEDLSKKIIIEKAQTHTFYLHQDIEMYIEALRL